MNLFDDIARITKVHAYAITGDKAHLKDIKPMGFNDPLHLPKPLPIVPPAMFDVWDDDLMHDCIGGKLTKPIQALLQAYEGQAGPCDPADVRALVKDLREAVKEEFKGL